MVSAAIWSSENPRATQNGFVIGSMAEMSSLKSRANRITAQTPGRASSARMGSPRVAGCALPRCGEGSTSVATASMPQQHRAAEEARCQP